MDRIARSRPHPLIRWSWLAFFATIGRLRDDGGRQGRQAAGPDRVPGPDRPLCHLHQRQAGGRCRRSSGSSSRSKSRSSETLGLRVDVGENPVEVYILDDRQSFEHFLTFYYPDLPHRRAFFLANGHQRVVYTFFGDRLEEDIRHEATHALLHVAVGDIPLWLDEGLAEYFEGPAERNGLNPEHVGRLPGDLASGWKPDLARLESLRSVRQMTPRDYRESWAWVHYLLNDGRPQKAALLAYLSDLRTSAEAKPISTRLEGPATEPMLAHLAKVREAPIALDAPRDPTVRLQSGPVDPTPASSSKRRGFMTRLRDFFGS